MQVLHAGALKMLVEVIFDTPPVHGDILHPVRDAMYLINREQTKVL